MYKNEFSKGDGMAQKKKKGSLSEEGFVPSKQWIAEMKLKTEEKAAYKKKKRKEKKKRESTGPPFIDKKMIKEQKKVYKKWRARRDAYIGRIVGLLKRMKSARRSIERYKKKKLDQPLSSDMGYFQKRYEKELKKEIKLIKDIEKESAALLNALEEII